MIDSSTSTRRVPVKVSEPAMFAQTATRTLLRGRCPPRIPRHLLARQRATREQTRSLFNFLRKQAQEAPKQQPVLSQDDLFHPFSKSPFPALRQRGEAIKKIAPCPVCVSSDAQELPTNPPVKKVAFECPDCGWPTHCSEEHWHADEEHQRCCGRLREVNEDEHDLRSGRKVTEFEMPGACCVLNALEFCSSATAGPIAFDETVSFANWDVFWYTRGFPSMDTERMRRHASKLLTYPMTIASVLHQHSGLTLSNQRVTPEGIRALAGALDFSMKRLRITQQSTSPTLDATRLPGNARDRGSRRWQARLPHLRHRRARRVLAPATRLGAA